MARYRIIREETEDKTVFFIQKRYFWFIWVTEVRYGGYDSVFRVEFDTWQKAQEYVEFLFKPKVKSVKTLMSEYGR